MWAPWRMAYVSTAKQATGCVLCDAVKQEDDAAVGILRRGNYGFVILNAFPYNPGHLMVVPYAHVGGIEFLDADASAELMALSQMSLRVLTRVLQPDGANIGINQGRAAGAGIADHVHQHIVPRWDGDTNFMTSVGHTKVLPELLHETYAKLFPAFSEPWDDKE
jgi:ATP adenylyltransferase